MMSELKKSKLTRMCQGVFSAAIDWIWMTGMWIFRFQICYISSTLYRLTLGSIFEQL